MRREFEGVLCTFEVTEKTVTEAHSSRAAKKGQGTMSLAGCRDSALLGLGATPQLPLVPPAMPNALKYAPLVAGSEASLRTNSRVRRRGIPLPLIILFSNSPAPSACAFSFGNRINSPLFGHSTRAGAFCRFFTESWGEEQLGGASADAQSYWQGRFAACTFVECV